MTIAQQQVTILLSNAGITGDIELSSPPKFEMGDIAFGCFGLAKEQGKNPAEVAKELAASLQSNEFFEKIEAHGPYVNFFVSGSALAAEVFGSINKKYGTHDIGKGKKVLVEFGCPNPLKVFHLGHLKNLITGESIARVFENAGHEVVRVNYQGDVGMHVAKAMWAMSQHDPAEIKALAQQPLAERLSFLGKIYAEGAQAFENEETKKDIVAMNKRVYEKDPAIQELYTLTVGWSLEYFDEIYKRLGTGFDRLYMESEVFQPGTDIVKEQLKKGVFKESQGAVIYEGSKHGLHDRVFINSEGFPTYEAKDIGLADAHFTDHNPDQVIHVVGKEQADYFKVVFKAIGEIWPDREPREYHVSGGYLQLKGQKKMSSRTGNVIAGDELVTQVEQKVREIMKKNELREKEDVIMKVTNAVLKYSMLKAQVSQDVGFDMNESVNISGDSGPYLLYIVARIKSILQKTGKKNKKTVVPSTVHDTEKQLLLALSSYPDVTLAAVEQYDPSKIAQYLFDLAQTFNSFYAQCPVIDAEEDVRAFRLALIARVEQVMTAGLHLLGIETVDAM